MTVCPLCGCADLNPDRVETDTVTLRCGNPNCLHPLRVAIPDSVAPAVRALGARLKAHEAGVILSRTLEDVDAGKALRFRLECRLAADQTRAEIRELIAA